MLYKIGPVTINGKRTEVFRQQPGSNKRTPLYLEYSPEPDEHAFATKSAEALTLQITSVAPDVSSMQIDITEYVHQRQNRKARAMVRRLRHTTSV